MAFKPCIISLIMAFSTLCNCFAGVRAEVRPDAPNSPPNACGEVLEQCDRAVEAAKKVISAQDLSITHLKEAQDRLLNDLAEAKSNERAMPTWLTISIGLLLGATAATLLRK
jgi:hypothetical protein